MDKLEVGMYVRTKYYGIAQITSIVCGQDVHFDNEKLENVSPYDGISKDGTYWRHNIIGKPSHNIIDLIQVGDYVNGFRVEEIGEYHSIKTDKVEIYAKVNCSTLLNCFYEEDIKSIVTKEQFESMEYKIGE